MVANRQTKDIKSECQIVSLKWKNKAVTGMSNAALSETIPFDISKYISNVSFQKTKDSPSGQFQITLHNDRDWKQHIEKGSWLVIYMSNNGGLSMPSNFNKQRVSLGDGLFGDAVDIFALKQQKSKIRCIGYVDTVRARGTTGQERGEFDTHYVVSGRDFGIIYEEAEVWHNQFQYDKTLLETIDAQITTGSIKTVDKLLEVMHHLFLAPEKIVRQPLKNDSLTTQANQWLLPAQLWNLLDLRRTKDTYYGNLPNVLNFGKTPASFPAEKPSALLNGIVWNRLKSFSLEPYHELFAELSDDGFPQLNFRLIPWVVDVKSAKKFPTIFSKAGNSILFAQPQNGLVELENIDIVEWDLGEDNHTRYNLFWSTISTAMVTTQTSNTMIGSNNPVSGFPRVLQESIKRHGLRMLYSEVNANIIFGTERADTKLIKEFNEYALELWQRSHDYESGTMTIIGNNEIRLGKCIHIEEDSQYNSDKYFYIEGYDETFIVDENGSTMWTQNIFCTRGIEKAVLKNTQLVTRRQTPFTDRGDFTEK